MQHLRHYIFDLDGTITHPQKGIIGGYHYAFRKLGFEDKTDEELVQLIGPPLKYVFSHIFNLSPEQTEQAIGYYREYYYEQGGMYEAIMFEGIKEIFDCLASKNKKLHIATNKAMQVDKILEHFGILDYFTSIEHYNEEHGVTTKEQMIENILEQHFVWDKNTAIMIGDREHDLSAAKNIGIPAIGVLYGFGRREELEKYHPLHIAGSVAELYDLLCV
jgi:phosphoglycolate phosphatase